MKAGRKTDGPVWSANALRAEFGEPQLPPDLRFHPAHTWVRKAGSGRVRIGLDRFAVRLIGCPIAVVFGTPGAHVLEGAPGCWMQDEHGLIPVKMPVSGRVVRVNENLHTWPGLVASEPCGDGWLLEVECPESELIKLLDAPAMEKRTEEDWKRIERRVTEVLNRESSGVGTTMQDGGEPVRDLRRILSPRRYRQLLLDLL
jgi:glycine cleavage system H protein